MKFPFILTTMAILGVTSANAASYNDEIRNFSIHGSSSSQNAISFPSDGVAIRRLAKDIRSNPSALALFEEKVFTGLCQTPQGTVNWNDNDTGFRVQCATSVRIAPDSRKIFREAHCAGFCVLYGNGFKKFEYNASINDYDCTCKSGNARNLGTTQTPTATSAAPQSKPASTTATTTTTTGTNVQQSRELTRYQQCVQSVRQKNASADAAAIKNACGDAPEYKTRDQEKVENQAAKKAAKEAECTSRTPPMAVKQNALGMWVCTDTDETKKQREAEKSQNQAYKAFCDDMDALESAFNKKIRQLGKNQ